MAHPMNAPAICARKYRKNRSGEIWRNDKSMSEMAGFKCPPEKASTVVSNSKNYQQYTNIRLKIPVQRRCTVTIY